MAIELVQLTAVKQALKMPDGVSKEDGLLVSLIRSVSADFQTRTGRNIAFGEYVEFLDKVDSSSTLFLKAWPVDLEKECTLYYDRNREFGETTKVDASYYEIDETRGKIFLYGGYAEGKRVFKVKYSGGMAVLGAPDAGKEFWTLYPDIAQAIVEEAVYEYKSLPNLGQASVTFAGAGSISLFKPKNTLITYEKAVLGASRLVL